MPRFKSFSQGTLVRPLLDVSREDLKQYAEQVRLSWIEDESNAEIQFDRNYLRHHIFPSLVARFNGAKGGFARSAMHCAEANTLLDELAHEDWQAVEGEVTGTLSVPRLLTLSDTRQKNIVRFWIQQSGFLLPSTVKLAQLQKDMLRAKQDASPCLKWKGAEIRRYQQNLYLMRPLAPMDVATVLPWNIPEKLLLPGIGSLVIHEKIGEGIMLPDDTTLTVKFRQGGERIHPAGSRFSHSLKKLFQAWGVPPWLRGRIPLLYHENTLVMVVGYAISEHYVVKSDDRRGWVVLVESPFSAGAHL